MLTGSFVKETINATQASKKKNIPVIRLCFEVPSLLSPVAVSTVYTDGDIYLVVVVFVLLRFFVPWAAFQKPDLHGT
jgi:hypothetical protein